MARFAAALAFFHPELDALTFPAWDCLPYDRVSPNSEIVSRRIDTLTRLATGAGDTPRVVLTTVNALVQRVPPRSLFDGRVLILRPGGRIGARPVAELLSATTATSAPTRCANPANLRCAAASSTSIPQGRPQPLRLDFFGDTLESIRSFDPLTQRSTGKLDQAALRPVSEVLLDDAAIRRFRSRYREQFGATGTDDPLYESVSAGRRYVGMEHWLPLYYEQLETLFDYLPGAGLSFDHQAEEARDHRLEAIADFYAARHNVRPWRGTAPGRRSIDRSGRRSSISTTSNGSRSCAGARLFGCRLSPPRRATATSSTPVARPARELRCRACRPQRRLFEAVRDYLEAERKAGQRAADRRLQSRARAERLVSVLRERGVADPARIADGDALAQAAAPVVGLAVLPVEQGFATGEFVLLGEQDILGDRLARSAAPPAQPRPIHRRGQRPVAGRSRRPCRSRHRPLRGAGNDRRRRCAA